MHENDTNRSFFHSLFYLFLSLIVCMRFWANVFGVQFKITRIICVYNRSIGLSVQIEPDRTKITINEIREKNIL